MDDRNACMPIHVNCKGLGEDHKCRNQIDCKYSTFSHFDFNLNEIKQKGDFKSCEIVENINLSPGDWKDLALKQLKFRDFLLDSYENNQTTMVNYGISLEKEIKDLHIRIEELNCQIKKIRGRKLNKVQATKFKNGCSENYMSNDNLKEETNNIPHDGKASSNETLAYKFDSKLNLNDATESEEYEIKTNNSHDVFPVTDVEKETKWDSSNIVEEVQSLAEENVTNSGYIFLEDCGMYYDSTSGYYYDPNTALYYDGATRTYFYYDHDSQSYVFHSQVDGLQSNADLKTKKEKKNYDENSDQVNDLEEGECSSSSSEFSEDVNHCKSPKVLCEEPCEYNQSDIAPSLRLMVTNGDLKGQLHIVTLDGGTIGREETNAVYLQDQSVSKLHASIIYKSEGLNDHHYYIKDIGSNNGTLVKGQRLSEPRKESQLTELGHGWDIQCGAICLSCHIHPGYLTCNECEPGLIMDLTKLKNSTASNCTQMDKSSKEKERRRQNKCLRKKFAIEFHAKDNEQLPSNQIYCDRTALRRDTVGSENPYQKTEVASIDINISKENKGFQLLEKMGWSEGQGLGLKQDGIVQPVVPIVPFNRTGLGGCPSVLYADNDNKRKIAKSSVTISAIDFTPPLKDKT